MNTSPPTNTRSHNLKVWPEFFHALADGSKTFEVRKNDRGFAVGDTLWLNEWIPHGDGTGEYTSGQIAKVVTYMLTGPQFGIESGYSVLGLADPEPDEFCKMLAEQPSEPAGDVVPRSRYDSCNRDWLDAEDRYARLMGTATAELSQARLIEERLRSELRGIISAYERRSEMFTNDADCAANLADRARAALTKE
jgi:hypothetical protein